MRSAIDSVDQHEALPISSPGLLGEERGGPRSVQGRARRIPPHALANGPHSEAIRHQQRPQAQRGGGCTQAAPREQHGRICHSEGRSKAGAVFKGARGDELSLIWWTDWPLGPGYLIWRGAPKIGALAGFQGRSPGSGAVFWYPSRD
jgi:hypothetical protein